MKSFIFILAIVALVTFFPHSHSNAERQSTPAKTTILEVFTSEYCPDAHPTDAVVQDIAKHNDDLLVISCHVTSFDKASENPNGHGYTPCGMRGALYSAHLNALGGGTPYFVVNGAYETKGVHADVLNTAITLARNTPIAVLSIEASDGVLTTDLPDIDDGPFIIAAFEIQNQSSDRRYINIVKAITELDKWDGSAKSLNISDTTTSPLTDQRALIIQKPMSGEIVAFGLY